MDAQSPLDQAPMTVAAAIVAGGQGLRMGGIAKGLLQVGAVSIRSAVTAATSFILTSDYRHE